jgi:branched-subunit amino acid transport protein AzlD
MLLIGVRIAVKTAIARQWPYALQAHRPFSLRIGAIRPKATIHKNFFRKNNNLSIYILNIVFLFL